MEKKNSGVPIEDGLSVVRWYENRYLGSELIRAVVWF